MRRYHLKRKYNVSPKWYEEQLKKQNHCCAICQTPGKLAIDHIHDGPVRALLCMSCNTGLGHFKENSGLLRKAAEYVDLHKKED